MNELDDEDFEDGEEDEDEEEEDEDEDDEDEEEEDEYVVDDEIEDEIEVAPFEDEEVKDEELKDAPFEVENEEPKNAPFERSPTPLDAVYYEYDDDDFKDKDCRAMNTHSFDIYVPPPTPKSPPPQDIVITAEDTSNFALILPSPMMGGPCNDMIAVETPTVSPISSSLLSDYSDMAEVDALLPWSVEVPNSFSMDDADSPSDSAMTEIAADAEPQTPSLKRTRSRTFSDSSLKFISPPMKKPDTLKTTEQDDKEHEYTNP
ncbi:hypothetical protein F4860DRAFT_479368 [Xylaria cubensis]|nr:hypothetical protein F4860DRAFT_479368 [Xylaria cubensis]